MKSFTLELTGRIFKDPESESGMYVSVVDGWNISTAGRTVDEAVAMTHRLIDEHLETASKLGLLERELEKVGTALADVRGRLHVRTRFALEAEADISLH